MVNLFIANTDNRWFDFLASEPNLTEVNFWWPGEMAFRAIQPGWVGSHILLDQIPSVGKIYLVRNGLPLSKEAVLTEWQQTLFLRDQGLEARGWLIEVMKCVEAIGKPEFQIDDAYAFESRLSGLYPNNKHVKQKIRQQLQVLRDRGYLDFVSRGYYRLRSRD